MQPEIQLPSTLFAASFNPVLLIAGSSAERRDALARVLDELGYSAATAPDAEETFRFIRESTPDVVFLDREFDGEFNPHQICSIVKDDPVLRATQVVMVTRENSRDEQNACIEARADTCVSERFDPGEIKVHLRKVVETRSIYNQMQGLNDKLQDMFLELSRLTREKEQDLREGGVFQKSIFPSREHLNEHFQGLGVEVGLYFQPFPEAQVSGDFWDVFHFQDDHIGFLLADAVGHGIPAALYSLYTLSALRRMVRRPGIDYFAKLSAELYRIMQGKHLAASFCTFQADRLAFCNAGLPAPVRVRGGHAEHVEFYGPVLGGFEITPDYKFLELDFLPGDYLIICTDGILEAKDPGGEEYGNDRLADLCARHFGEPAQRMALAVRSDVEDFQQGAPAADDATILVFHRK